MATAANDQTGDDATAKPDTTTPGKTATRTLVLVNKGSGKKTCTDLDDLLRKIDGSSGVTVESIAPGSDITRRAAQGIKDGYGVIVAAGGDGTISGVSSAVCGTDVSLGVLPLGTFNFFARSLDIPLDPAEAWAVIAANHARPVSIAEINGRTFINNASIGAYASVLAVREDVYRRWGRSRLTAYWSVIKAMVALYHPLRMRITVDGTAHDLRSPMAFAAVRPFQLEKYGLAGADDIRDGNIVVYLAPGGGRLMLLWRALKVMLREVERGEDYTMFTGRDIEIETFRQKRLVAWDGERSRMTNPFRLKILRDQLTVIVPAPDGGHD